MVRWFCTVSLLNLTFNLIEVQVSGLGAGLFDPAEVGPLANNV